MNQRAIIYLILAVVGIPVLIQIGAWSATNPIYAGISGLFVVGIVIFTQLGRKCWLLIPFFSAFTGSLNILPGHFAPSDVAVGLVALILVMIWLVRRFPVRIRFGSIEIALLVLMAFLGQAFVRNPAGLAVFGSDIIGGRPYFEIAASTVAFVILSIQIVDFKDVRTMVIGTFIGSMIVAVFDLVIGMFSNLAFYTARVYQGGMTSKALGEYFDTGQQSDPEMNRLFYLRMFYQPIIVLVLSFKSPFQLLSPKNIGYLLLLVFAVICILLSGFRSGVSDLGMLGIAAFLLHRKPLQLVAATVLFIPLLAVVIALQGVAYDLPLSAQRALSFLPGDWNSEAVSHGENSSEWRFEIWREALTNERYIRNKWLGDGFGFTARELDYQQELMVRGVQANEQLHYTLTIGAYHSGPVESIKRIGYVGMLVLLTTMGVLLKASAGLVNRARGTPYYPYALFVTLPLVILPVKFVLIFGAFQSAVSLLFLHGGMLRLIQNSLERWEKRGRPDATGISEIDGPPAKLRQ